MNVPVCVVPESAGLKLGPGLGLTVTPGFNTYVSCALVGLLVVL